MKLKRSYLFYILLLCLLFGSLGLTIKESFTVHEGENFLGGGLKGDELMGIDLRTRRQTEGARESFRYGKRRRHRVKPWAGVEAFAEAGPFNLSSRFESLASHQNVTNRFTGEGFSVGCRPKICTRDAKRCPDGSFVGRDPYNNCKWRDCPKKEGMRLDIHSPSKMEGYQSAEILHKINRMGGSGFRFHGDTNLGFHRDVMSVITEDPNT
jgi:hypothetical protein